MDNNSLILNKYFIRMNAIHKQLSDAHVPHVFEEIEGGYHIIFPSWKIGYVAVNDFTYGHDDGCVECIGFQDVSHDTYSDIALLPDECASMIINEYTKRYLNDCI